MAEIPFDPDEILEALNAEVAAIMRGDAIAVEEVVVNTSPVGDPSLWEVNQGRQGGLYSPPGYKPGHLVKNWQVTIGTPSDSEVEGEDPGRFATIQDARRVIATYTAEDVANSRRIFVQNNVPYIIPIAFGHSQQAPAGFIETGTQAVIQDRGTVVLGTREESDATSSN